MLDTIKCLSIKENLITPILYVDKDGNPIKSGADKDSEVSWAYDEYDMRFFTTIFLLINLIKNGDTELSLEISKKYHNAIICERGYAWSIPEHTEGLEMIPFFFDITHHMFVWALPALLLDGDIKKTCSLGGFIYRIRESAKDRIVRASQ